MLYLVDNGTSVATYTVRDTAFDAFNAAWQRLGWGKASLYRFRNNHILEFYIGYRYGWIDAPKPIPYRVEYAISNLT